ncbi:MAG: hypothetical protein H5U11_13880 [Rhizobium sp.]|nr:hypothetical protein [Rhizobium sp.]
MSKKKPKPKTITVTMKINKDGSWTFRSTGGFDLSKLGLPVKEQVRDE